MITTAITAEYNPFHNGHKYHIDKSKFVTKADYIISVMSGNYVQRGEPAIFDKWIRTKCALNNGVDIVLELPAFFACCSAEYFASSAVDIMEKTNIVNYISFGTETDNLNELKEFSKAVLNENDIFKEKLSNYLSQGLSYPAAREKALKNIGINTPVFSANNILSSEYLKALNKLNSKITPVAIKRTDNGYNSMETTENFASATKIRSLFEEDMESVKKFVPENIFELLNINYTNGQTVTANNLSHILNYVLRTSSLEELKAILDIREGIENKILKSIQNNYNFKDIAFDIKSKRYSFTGIQRMLLHIILNLKSQDMAYFKENGFCQYIRVLGFKKSALPLLKSLSENSSVPVIINIKKDESKLSQKGKFLLDFEKKADDIYFMCQNNNFNRGPNKNYTTPPVII